MGNLLQVMKIEIRRFSPVRTDSASVVSAMGPFDLGGSDWTLVVSVDGGAGQSIAINQASFSDPANVSADDMLAVIDAALTGGEVYKDANGSLVVGTDTAGDNGSIELSGDAVSLLGFDVTSSVGGGFNSIFGSIKPVDNGTQEGTTRLREMDAVILRCQVDRGNWGGRRMLPGGVQEMKSTIFTVERSQLSRLGLIDSRGIPMINVGDRVTKLMSRSGRLVESFEDENGLWVHEVTRAGHGLRAFGDRTNRIYYLVCNGDRVTT